MPGAGRGGRKGLSPPCARPARAGGQVPHHRHFVGSLVWVSAGALHCPRQSREMKEQSRFGGGKPFLVLVKQDGDT